LKSRPEGVTDPAVAAALADGWGLPAGQLQYAPVGAGSYHWSAGRYFVTVDDLDVKPWLGSSRDEVLTGLRSAMEAARALAVLPFVLAPIAAASGEVVRRLGERYAVTVFPYLDGTAGEFGAVPSADERAEVLDLLAALHKHEAGVAGPPPRPIALPARDVFDGQFGGPYAAQVRELMAEAGPRIRDLLATFDERAAVASGLPRVITHGEPHPGNIIRTATGPVLIDWDTVGLAPPERDLWFLAPGDFGSYEAATGYRPAPAALDLYRLRWHLDDIAATLTDLNHAPQAPHPTPQAPHPDQALQTLRTLLASP
jgi:spectinomycin phosphotransferase